MFLAGMAQYDVYISCSRVDEDLASAIYRELKNDGIRCFLMSEDLVAGDYADAIQSAIIQSEYFIFIYGDRTEQSVFQRRELDLALQSGKRVCTLFLSSSDDGVIRSILTKRTDLFTTSDSLCDHIRERVHSDGMITSTPVGRLGRDGQPKVRRSSRKRLWIWGVVALLLVLFVAFMAFFSFKTRESPSFSSPIESFDESFDVDTSRLLHQIDVLEMYYGPNPGFDALREKLNSSPYPEPSSMKPNHWIWFVPVCVSLGGVVLLIARRKKRKNIKLSSDVDARIAIDGKQVAEINAGGVYATSLRKGEYLIDFASNSGEHHRVVQKIADRDTHVVLAEFLEKQEIKFRCFIAGSLRLSAERNALIAVVSKLYNRWESEHFRISSHTFEDFSRDVVPGGQQKLYDTFIENEADWCVFVLADGIGEKTLGEYRVAMDSLHKNGHPRILILASPKAEDNEALVAIKKEIIEADQYWNTCNNIEHMQSIFKDCVEWDVTLLSKSRRQS